MDSLRAHSAVLAVTLGMLFLGIPLMLLAQTQGDLETAVRAAILSDPRAASMSSAEIDAMVAALSGEARTQGVTAADIAWQPQDEATFAATTETAECGWLCKLTNAFGFDGSDITIPVALGICAAILLFVIGSLLHHRHGHHPVAGAIQPVAPPQNIAPSHETT